MEIKNWWMYKLIVILGLVKNTSVVVCKSNYPPQPVYLGMGKLENNKYFLIWGSRFDVAGARKIARELNEVADKFEAFKIGVTDNE